MAETDSKTQTVNWPVAWAVLKLWVFHLLSKPAMLFLYLTFVSEGIRQRFEMAGIRLSKLPWLSWMADYEDTYKLDLAHLMAVVLFGIATFFWVQAIRLFLQIEEKGTPLAEAVQGRWLIWLIGLAVLGGDAYFFYRALIEQSFGETEFSVDALIATGIWVITLIAVNYIGIHLHQKVKQLREESKSGQ